MGWLVGRLVGCLGLVVFFVCYCLLLDLFCLPKKSPGHAVRMPLLSRHTYAEDVLIDQEQKSLGNQDDQSILQLSIHLDLPKRNLEQNNQANQRPISKAKHRTSPKKHGNLGKTLKKHSKKTKV